MTGSTDVAAMLRTLEVVALPDEYVYASLPADHPAIRLAKATITETEGLTAVLLRSDADSLNVDYDYVAAWLTLSVHSSLEAVGLTAAFSQALGQAGISANVLAGFYHDHVLVAAPDRARAISVLHGLRG
ncbi:ACT domain-containing protein [Arthrobacter sp.]|uniref:ACT domain-containing protein n=1 Tax=Arthrobacter sp. TaxID=1667 RepID=UPI0026E0A1FF|nr:ACT domain-containing protein [Arthrobacter sp.]MDO5753032.1 ACT domain-containing protein [Arthrobacter sp.]